MEHAENAKKDSSSADWRNNRLRARLAAGEFIVGLTITSSNLETAVLGAIFNLRKHFVLNGQSWSSR